RRHDASQDHRPAQQPAARRQVRSTGHVPSKDEGIPLARDARLVPVPGAGPRGGRRTMAEAGRDAGRRVRDRPVHVRQLGKDSPREQGRHEEAWPSVVGPRGRAGVYLLAEPDERVGTTRRLISYTLARLITEWPGFV